MEKSKENMHFIPGLRVKYISSQKGENDFYGILIG